MQLKITDYNTRKLTLLQRPPYKPIYDESSDENSEDHEEH
jgi:hypothetical protein